MFTHTPYDGARQPFSIGLAPIDTARWIEPDARLADELARKEALIAGRRDVVWREEAATHAAQGEVRDAIAEFLTARFPDLYKPEGAGLRVVPADRLVALDDGEAPLLAASRLVQDDLCLMRRGDAGWRLAAASLCFPSSWSLAEKFGRPLHEIHAPVPGLAGRMGEMIARIFDNMKPGALLERFNWSIYGDNRLHHPETRTDPLRKFPADVPVMERAHIRVERQTLRRMPVSGDILFTIRVHADPLAALARHPRGPSLAAGLRVQLLALNAGQLAYKGLTQAQERLAAALAGMADGRPITGASGMQEIDSTQQGTALNNRRATPDATGARSIAMARKLAGKLVIATHNQGKLREMRELLAPYGVEAVSAGELGLPEPEETGATFVANALIKAQAAARAANLPALADDSGICLDALGGAPGIYSARWAGGSKDFAGAMRRIEDELAAVGANTPARRRAHFVSALVVAWPDGHTEMVEGKVFGAYVWPPRGMQGFGYDPAFLPAGHTRTFGEMSAEEKHGIPADGGAALSHRARAFQELAKICLG